MKYLSDIGANFAQAGIGNTDGVCSNPFERFDSGLL